MARDIVIIVSTHANVARRSLQSPFRMLEYRLELFTTIISGQVHVLRASMSEAVHALYIVGIKVIGPNSTRNRKIFPILELAKLSVLLVINSEMLLIVFIIVFSS